MNNPFYSAFSGRNNMNIGTMLQQLKSNPVQLLAQKGINIPPNMANDPNAILQHLLSSGKVSQNQINAAYQMGRQFKVM